MVELTQGILNFVKVAVCGSSLLYIFLVVIDLTYFLSVPRAIKGSTYANDTWVQCSWGLFVNMVLLSLFVFQHSVLAAKEVSIMIKHALKKWKLDVIYRSLYILTTAYALQVLLTHWVDIPQVTLWSFNLNYKPLWWLYLGTHIAAWIIIYVGNICTDITELLGIKQVRYSFSRFPRDPNQLKSEDLLRLYSHMRHPSFLAFTLIFWIAPVMSLDRFLLAVILTLYMGFTWNTDNRDYSYQKYQYVRKYHELEHLNR